MGPPDRARVSDTCDDSDTAARDSRACHGHTGAPHMGRLTHHNTPGPVGRPRRDSVGHESSPLWEQAGQVGDSASPYRFHRGNAARNEPAPRRSRRTPTPRRRLPRVIAAGSLAATHPAGHRASPGGKWTQPQPTTAADNPAHRRVRRRRARRHPPATPQPAGRSARSARSPARARALASKVSTLCRRSLGSHTRSSPNR